ncbi:MAG: hypothetical protein WC728_15585, partial [Elusimicrobiota bacterium]
MSIPVGMWVLAYGSRDKFGNYETLRSTTLYVDGYAPVTTPAFVGPGAEYLDAQTGRLFTSQDRQLVFESTDTVFPASGPGNTFYSLDPSPQLLSAGLSDATSAQFSLFTGPIPFSNGVHTVAYGSRDRVWNYEPLRTAVIYVDSATPKSELSYSIPPIPGGPELLVGGKSTITVTAKDPGDPASGIATTYFLLDLENPEVCSGPSPTDPRCLDPYYKGPFSLSGGTHAVVFFSRDNVGHLEQPPNVQVVLVDTTPPKVADLSPNDGKTFTIGELGFTISATVSDDYDPAPRLDLGLVQTLNKGPVGATSLHVSTGDVIDPAYLDDGIWKLQASATDFVMNSTTVYGAEFEIIHDTLPPRTALLPAAIVSGQAFVPRFKPVVLISTDDLLSVGDGIGLGVAYQEFWEGGTLIARNLNTGSGSVFSSTFSLSSFSDGLHTLSYFSEDVLGHKELLQYSTVAVDGTAPSMSFQILGGTRTDLLGRTILSTSTLVVLSGTDPVAGGVASGVKALHLTLDSIEEVIPGTYTARTLSEGLHSLSVFSEDYVGNLGPVFSTNVVVDVSPPQIWDAKASAAGSEQYVPTTQAISSMTVDARVKVKDLYSGLNISGAPLIALTTDAYTVGLWHLNELPGSTTAYDSSVRHNDARVSTSVLFVPGLFGNAVNTNQPP